MNQKTSHREKSLGPISPGDVPIESLPLVSLDRDHIEQASELAERRNGSYDAIDGGVVFGNRDALTSHQIGLLGELAVAQLYGLSVDRATYQRGDDGKDHQLFDAGIDVKTTATKKLSRPELLVRADKPLASDLYIRAHVIDWTSTGANVRLVGCATRETVKSQTPRYHPGSTKNHVVSPEEMEFLPMLRPTDQ